MFDQNEQRRCEEREEGSHGNGGDTRCPWARDSDHNPKIVFMVASMVGSLRATAA